MAPGDLHMYLVGVFAIVTGAQLIYDPLGAMQRQRPILAPLESLFNVPAPPTSAVAMAAGGGEGFYRFLGALIYSVGFYYFCAAWAGDERFKRTTVWGRIPFGLFNIIWPLVGTTGNSFFLSFGLFDLVTGLIMAYQVGIGGGVGYAKSERKLKGR